MSRTIVCCWSRVGCHCRRFVSVGRIRWRCLPLSPLVSFDYFVCFSRSRRYCNSDTKRPIDLQPFSCLRNVGAAFASIQSTFTCQGRSFVAVAVVAAIAVALFQLAGSAGGVCLSCRRCRLIILFVSPGVVAIATAIPNGRLICNIFLACGMLELLLQVSAAHFVLRTSVCCWSRVGCHLHSLKPK